MSKNLKKLKKTLKCDPSTQKTILSKKDTNAQDLPQLPPLPPRATETGNDLRIPKKRGRKPLANKPAPTPPKKVRTKANIVGIALNVEEHTETVKREALSYRRALKIIRSKGLTKDNYEQFHELVNSVDAKIDALFKELEHIYRAHTLSDYSLAEHLQDMHRSDLVCHSTGEFISPLHS